MLSKNISQTKRAAGSQEVEWPDGSGAPQPREGPHASLLQSPAMASPHRVMGTGRTCTPNAGRAPHPALAQSSAATAVGTEQCQLREGRREREFFQEEGSQTVPAICY